MIESVIGEYDFAMHVQEVEFVQSFTGPIVPAQRGEEHESEEDEFMNEMEHQSPENPEVDMRKKKKRQKIEEKLNPVPLVEFPEAFDFALQRTYRDYDEGEQL